MSARAGEDRLFELYYLLTPGFLLVDVLMGLPVRAAAIESTGWRLAYYALLVGIGVWCRLRPRWAHALGLVEGSVNLLLLLLSVLLPIWNAAIELPAGGEVVGLAGVLNLALVGSMTVLAMKRSERALWAGVQPPHRLDS